MQAHLDLPGEEYWHLATGLGTGLSGRQSVCGAVTGGILALGLGTARQRGWTRDDRKSLRGEVYAHARELMRRFEARFGTMDCRAMVGCDLSSPAGRQSFQETGQMDRTCRPAVRLVIETVLELSK